MAEHSHEDYRESGQESCRLSSACEACDIIADSAGLRRYGEFEFNPSLRDSWPQGHRV